MDKILRVATFEKTKFMLWTCIGYLLFMRVIRDLEVLKRPQIYEEFEEMMLYLLILQIAFYMSSTNF